MGTARRPREQQARGVPRARCRARRVRACARCADQARVSRDVLARDSGSRGLAHAPVFRVPAPSPSRIFAMSPSATNHRFLRALRREPVDMTPVWIMRQAGRYLPEYRATRERAGSFLALAKTPELACEVTLQPLARFPLDAAILFSDILTIPDAMGLGLHFIEGEGPRFRKPVQTADAIRKLAAPDAETELRYVMDAVRTIKKALNGSVPLIGFSGSPWTLATYMVEGR